MLYIQKPTDTITPNLTAMIYGAVGLGKTTLANTAKKPLLFNFFNSGHHRSKLRKDAVRIDDWRQVEEIFTPSFLTEVKAYDTIVLDDIGTIQHLIQMEIIKINSDTLVKHAVLTLQGYARLRNMFINFFSRLKTLGKDIIIIAHESGETIGDKTSKRQKIRPDISGSTGGYLERECDIIGHLTTNENHNLVVNFQNRGTATAKSFVDDVPSIELAHYKDPNFEGTLSRLFERGKSQINLESQTNTLEDFKNQIEALGTPQDFDAFALPDDLSPTLKKVIKGCLRNRLNELGIEYDKESKTFRLQEDESTTIKKAS